MFPSRIIAFFSLALREKVDGQKRIVMWDNVRGFEAGEANESPCSGVKKR